MVRVEVVEISEVFSDLLLSGGVLRLGPFTIGFSSDIGLTMIEYSNVTAQKAALHIVNTVTNRLSDWIFHSRVETVTGPNN
jgi:hypothetical protein